MSYYDARFYAKDASTGYYEGLYHYSILTTFTTPFHVVLYIGF